MARFDDIDLSDPDAIATQIAERETVIAHINNQRQGIQLLTDATATLATNGALTSDFGKAFAKTQNELNTGVAAQRHAAIVDFTLQRFRSEIEALKTAAAALN